MLQEALETPRAIGARWVLAILLASLSVRMLGVALDWDDPLDGDAHFYSSQARTIAQGDGYTHPFAGLRSGVSDESADHPPLFVTYLAIPTALGADTPRWHRIASALLGVGTTALMCVLGFRLAGRRGAIVTGMLGATWPNLWFWDIGVQSESITALSVTAFSVAGLAFLRRPSPLRLAGVGVTVGLCALGRAELLLCAVSIPLLATAVAGLSRTARLRWVAAGVAGVLLVVTPWTVYNLTRFDRPVALSNGAGLVLVSANCDTTYHGSTIGYWWFGCSVSGSTAAGILPTDDQSTEDSRKRPVAIAYARDNVGRTPAVATARAVRYLGLWPPVASAKLAETNESMAQEIYLASQAAWLTACALASVATVRLRREGQRLSPVLLPPLVGLITAVAIYGIIRFRAPLEPPVIALAAAGGLMLFDQFRGRTDDRGSTPLADEVPPEPVL